MTKKEIVRIISERSHLTQLQTKEIVQWTFDAIIETLLHEGRIELRNFGVFEVKRRKARKARNPRTGDKVEVDAKNVVTFQPGKEMEEQVRRMQVLPAQPTKTRKARAKSTGATSQNPPSANSFHGGDTTHPRSMEPALSGSANG
jgi:integration host factor subunit beta